MRWYPGAEMPLALRGFIPLRPHTAGGFDHGDVHTSSGRVFVAHTGNDSIDVIDGTRMELERTVPGCPEGSGVLCTQSDHPLVFAAARGAGKVLVLDALTCELQREIAVGPRPNGLARDRNRRQLLVADVEDFNARLVDPLTSATFASTRLPGRPRWCVFDAARDRFLVNIREPASVVALAGGTAKMQVQIPVSAAGPHGLDIDRDTDRAFVACDAGRLVLLDLTRDLEVASLSIGGEPDAIWFNAKLQHLYVAIGAPGLIEVVDCQRGTVVERLTTEEGAHTTAFDASRQILYVFYPLSSRAAVYQEQTDPRVGTEGS